MYKLKNSDEKFKIVYSKKANIEGNRI